MSKFDLVLGECEIMYLTFPSNLVRRLQGFAHSPDSDKPPRTLPEKAAAANPEKKFLAPIRRKY